MGFNPSKPGFGFEKPNGGETNEWLTPPQLVTLLGDFDLDPCASYITHLAVDNYRLPQDGLTLPWYGRVWCNPPYGNNVLQWVDKMAAHGDGILLIFSRCETKAWERVWATGDAFLFPFGRIKFRRSDGAKARGGTAPSTLIAYGKTNITALEESGISGALEYKPKILKGVRVSTL